MFQKKKQRFIQNLMLVGVFCLSSCTRVCYNYCPVYPVAGENVAKELENMSYEEYTNTWEWIGRIDKLRQELELCQK